MKKYSILTLVFILLTVSLQNVFSQTRTQRIYNGNYTFTNVLGLNKLIGNATYGYTDASDGSRIYNGSFEFNGKCDGSNYEVKGQFKDNKQVGEWSWKTGGAHISMSFNDLGIVDGPFKLDFYPRSSEYNGTYSGTYKNGKIVEVTYQGDVDVPDQFGGKKIAKVYIHGHFNNKERPEGVWDYKELGTSEGTKEIIVKFAPSGEKITSGYINQQTGDWKDYKTLNINIITESVKSELNRCIFRSTPKI